MIISVGGLLVITGSCVWMAIGCGKPETCELYDATFENALWLSWGIFFDPGTQTGIPSTEDGGHKMVVILFSFLGFILNLIFLGLVVEKCRTELDSWRRIHGKIVANGHTVVLGWTDKTLFLLGELADMMTDSAEGAGNIVVLGDLDPIEMRMEVNIAFPTWSKQWRRVRLRFMQGKPYEVDDLQKVSVFSAARVIVLGCSRRPRVADAQMLTTICALRCLPENQDLTPATKVIAEMKQSQNMPVVLHLGNTSSPGPAGARRMSIKGKDVKKEKLTILPVGATQAVNSILVMLSLDSSAGTALLDLMNFQGEQIEQVSCRFVQEGESVTFGMLRTTFVKCLPLGLIRQESQEIDLAPADTCLISPGDQLLVVAADAKDALMEAAAAAKSAKIDPEPSDGATDASGASLWGSAPKPPGLKRQSTNPHFGAYIRHRRATVRHAQTNILRKIWCSRLTRKSFQVGVDPTSSPTMGTAIQSILPQGMPNLPRGLRRGRKLIFVGWQRGLEELLRIFDSRLPMHSEMHIVSEMSEKWRLNEMSNEGLALNGRGKPDENGKYPENALKNVEIFHYVGFTTDVTAMRKLPIEEADSAVIVADVDDTINPSDTGGGAELQIADSEAITSTVLFQRERRRLELEAAKNGRNLRPLTIVTEFVDLLTRRLLDRQPDLLEMSPDDDVPTSAPAAAEVKGGGGLGGGMMASIALKAAERSAGRQTPTTAPTLVAAAVDAGRRRRPCHAASSANSPPPSPSSRRGGRIRPDALSPPESRLSVRTAASPPASPPAVSAPSPLGLGNRTSRMGGDAETPHVPGETPPTDPNGPRVTSVVFHRNYIETTALSLASHSVASWATVCNILDTTNKTNLVSVTPFRVIPDDAVREGRTSFSFYEMSELVMMQSLGLLIGWKHRSQNEVVINPPKKREPLRWTADDELVVIGASKW